MSEIIPEDGFWSYRCESHLGDHAWSLFDMDGERSAVGLTRQDAFDICKAMNDLIRDATPKLLEACGAAENELLWQLERGNGNDVTRAALSLIRAAISKAEAKS